MKSFKIVLDEEEPGCWPFWPLKLQRRTFRIAKGFKLQVFQREVKDGKLAKDPLLVEGYVSQDGQNVTVTVGFHGGARLKRHTT